MENSLFGNRKRGLFKCNIPVILALAALVLLGTYIQREESIGVMSGSEPLEKKVAITFDDGPNADYTELLLEGLEERGVRATFFLPGSKVEENDIILLHDASESSVKAAFKIIDALEEEGYVFVTVDEILFD